MSVSSLSAFQYEKIVHSELLEDEGCKALFLQAPSQQYPPGVELFRQGDEAGDIYCIERGLVKLTHLGVSGQELIVSLRLAGNLLGNSPVLLGVVPPVLG